MTTPTQSSLQIAHGALLDLEAAKETFGLIESLLYFVSRGKELPQSQHHVNNLVDVAWNLAANAANNASCNYERINQALDKLAPQNAVEPKRGADGEASQ